MAAKRRLTVAIDCETDPFKRGRSIIKPFIWGAFEGKSFRHFPNVPLLLDHLATLGQSVAYAHNGGRFDFLLGLVEFIQNYTPLRIVGGRLLSFRIGETEFRDSYSLLPIALREYKKEKFSYRKLEKGVREKHMPEIKKYLESDVRYLWELVEDFLVKYGALLTIASAGLKQLVTCEGLERPKTTKLYFNVFKEFYFGGHVESMANGKKEGPIRVWDINSAYPYAMMALHPWAGEFNRLSSLPKKVSGADFIVLDAASLGAFPLHDKRLGTYFPYDGKIREFKVTGWEFLAARDLKLLKSVNVKSVRQFRKQVRFSKYVEKFYELKKSAKKGSTDRIFAKLLLNASYGKLGQDPSNFQRFQIAPLGDIAELSKSGWKLRQPLQDGRAIFAKPESEDRMRYYDVATAASITGWVRAYWLRNRVIAERSGSEVFCGDTDCLHVKGPWRPHESEDLGDWKPEYPEGCKPYAVEGYYAGKKMYALKFEKLNGRGYVWKTASKGAKLSGPQIALIAGGGQVKYRQLSPTFSILGKTRLMERTIRNTNKARLVS